MQRIVLLTHLNGPDNKGGPAYGVPGTTVEVDDDVAADAIKRGFATAYKGDAVKNRSDDDLAHLHSDPVALRANADLLQAAADKAAKDAKAAQETADKAKADADAADKTATGAEKDQAKADKAAGITTADAPGAKS